MKKAIAIDLDDVLAEHAAAFVAFSNERYGTHLEAEDYTDHWSDLWHVEITEIERRAKEFHVPETTLQYAHKEEAATVLTHLRQRYHLYIVTARERDIVGATFTWLEDRFGGIFDGVHFVPIWEPDNTLTKAAICQQIGAEYLIDDLPLHCNVAAETGLQALLFGDYNWNRTAALAPGVVRVKDWKAIERYFDGRDS